MKVLTYEFVGSLPTYQLTKETIVIQMTKKPNICRNDHDMMQPPLVFNAQLRSRTEEARTGPRSHLHLGRLQGWWYRRHPFACLGSRCSCLMHVVDHEASPYAW